MGQSISAPDKGQIVHAIFTRIARNYDWTNALLSLWQDKKWRRFAVEHCHPQPGEIGLDLGCGTGKITLELARSMRGTGEVIGLDFNEAMLKIAKDRKETTAHGHTIHFIQGNAMSLPFPDNAFDYVMAGFILRNVENMEKALSEMVRVVKPEGRLVILELSHPGFTPLRQFYSLYFHHILPWVGRIICGSDIPYSYLPASVQSFQDPVTFCRTLSQREVDDVRYYSLSGGIAVLHEGRKKAAP